MVNISYLKIIGRTKLRSIYKMPRQLPYTQNLPDDLKIKAIFERKAEIFGNSCHVVIPRKYYAHKVFAVIVEK